MEEADLNPGPSGTKPGSLSATPGAALTFLTPGLYLVGTFIPLAQLGCEHVDSQERAS